MKCKNAALLVLLLSVWIAPGQGPISPPGPPGPLMKSLAQVEPRIPISTAGTVITESGNYYVTNDLVATVSPGWVIEIRATATNVVLDLNGFTLSAAPGVVAVGGAAPVGVYLAPRMTGTVQIKNGHIRGGRGLPLSDGLLTGAGLAFGVFDFPPVDSRALTLVEDVTCSGLVNAILAVGGTVRNCQVTESNIGISAALIQHCMVRCQTSALEGTTIQHCFAECRSETSTSAAVSGVDVLGCTVKSDVPESVDVIRATRVTDCTVATRVSEGRGGIRAGIVTNCIAYRIDAGIAVGCIRTTGTITNRYNMP